MKYVYKAVTALLAIATLPATFFLEFLFIQASTSLVDVGVEESFTLKRFYDIFVTGTDPFAVFFSGSSGFLWPEQLDPLAPYLILTVVFLALAIIAAIFICVWSICSNKRIVNIIASGAGILFVILMNVFFNKAASFLTLGTINIVKALAGSGLIASLIGSVVNIDTLVLGGFKNALIILFAVIIIWTLSFILIELGDEKEEKPAKKK